MDQLPLVSVIIPAYNHEKYVQETIMSIIEQTYKNIELIIIDDGSKDSTWQKILEMQGTCKKRFVRIDFSTQENSGTCLTLNCLIEKTQSEYVYLIASDDKAAPEAIEKEYTFLSENPDYALVVGANDIIDADGKRCFWDKNMNNVYNEEDAEWLSLSDEIMKFGDQLGYFSSDFGTYKSLLYFENHIPNGYLIRKSIFDKIEKFTPDAPLEDYFLMFQISKYAKMKYLPDTLFYYRWHGANTSLNKSIVDNTIRTQLYEIKNICPRIYHHILGLQAQNTDLQNRLDGLKSSRTFLVGQTVLFVPKLIKKLLYWLKRIVANIIGFAAKCVLLIRDLHKSLSYLYNIGLKSTLVIIRERINQRKRYKRYISSLILSAKERKAQEKKQFPRDIKFSILVPLYNTPKNILIEMVNSVVNQTYKNWELCLADGSDGDHGYVKEIIEELMMGNKNIKYVKLKKNWGISENTNSCIGLSTGDYLGLLDHDDLLHPSALFEVMRAICDKDADFIYTDEDKVDEKTRNYFNPHFKPGFAVDNLRAYNYICHFTVFRKTLLDEIGKFDSRYDGAQDYDIILRLTEKARSIVHIPLILYHWRVMSNSTAFNIDEKAYAINAGIEAVRSHLDRCELKADVIRTVQDPSVHRMVYKLMDKPLVSIVIPNKDHILDLEKCISSIMAQTNYDNYEIVVVENNSKLRGTFEYYEEIKKHSNIKVFNFIGEFNYPRINNFGVEKTEGDYIVFLNNDIEIISPLWIEEMLMFCQRKDISAVGAKLYYYDNTIQHGGVILGLDGIAGHSHKHFPKSHPGYFLRLSIQQNLSAVTAACMMIKRPVFDEIGGFNPLFKVAFNDIDLCMRLRKAGYLIAWTPFAEAYHYESKSRGYEDTHEKIVRFRKEIKLFQKLWAKELAAGDPYYNVNLTRKREDFSLA